MPKREYRWRHLALLVSIMILFIIGPMVVPLHNGILIFNVAGITVLLAATYAVSGSKPTFLTAIILSAISVVGSCLLLSFHTSWAVIVSHTFFLILLSFFSITILKHVMQGGRVTADRIYAGICVYMLVGYAWAFAYALLDELQPESFRLGTELIRGDYTGRVMQMRYFSFVTLATVGYGDIVPRSPAAQTFVILEAIMGQFYLVALMGRLVGLYIVHSTSARDQSPRR